MRQRKVISILFAMTLALAACGNHEDASGQGTSETMKLQTESIAAQESADTEEIEEQTEESDFQKTSTPEEDIQVESVNTSANLEETVLVDENDVRISVTGIEYKDHHIELKLTLENNSDKDLSFISGSIGYSCNAVNGYMMPVGYLNTKVAAGKKANETIRFGYEELSLYGITEIADIQLGFDIQDEDYNHFYTGPRQLRTSAADSYDYEVDTYHQIIRSGAWEKLYKCTIDYFAEEELFDQNNIQIISEALVTNKDGEKTFFIEVVNDSEEQIVVALSDIMLNGLGVCDSTWSSGYVNPKTRCIIDLSPSSMLEEAYWEALGISDIGDFSFSFLVYDSDYESINAQQTINIVISEMAAMIDETGDELYNENGIRIISKGLLEDSSTYSDDIHMLLLVENSASETIYIDDVFDSLSVNDFMTDYYMRSRQVPPGKYALVDIEIYASSLENSGIMGIEDISEAEISFKVRDEDYDTIAEPAVFVIY